MPLVAIVIAAALWLAYSNGANDNFKGVATLYGRETTIYRGALTWATLATFAGSLVSVFVARRLVVGFSGKGLVPDALAGSPEFAAAVGLGAAMTVLVATRIGMPTSTTHALIGGLLGAGLAVLRAMRRSTHALLLTTAAFAPSLGIAAAGVAMAVGGLFHSRRVAETMSRRITDLNPGQGFTANVTTAGLVLFASNLGVPVSTTHVSCGSIFGIGLANRSARPRTISSILATWVTTLPAAAGISALLFGILRSS